MHIKAVFFDYDDTIINVETSREYARHTVANFIASMLDLSEEQLVGIIKDVEIRMESMGVFDRRVWFKEVFKSLNLKLDPIIIDKLVTLYWDSWISRSKLFPDTLPVLNSLRQCGYRIGLITNTDGEPGLKRNRIRRDKLENVFDLIVVAGDDTRSVKPSAEPFKVALKLMSIKGCEAMYVGDRPEVDVPGAKAMGMHTVLVDRRGLLTISNVNSKPDYIIKSLFELPKILKCNMKRNT